MQKLFYYGYNHTDFIRAKEELQKLLAQEVCKTIEDGNIFLEEEKVTFPPELVSVIKCLMCFQEIEFALEKSLYTTVETEKE
jgi:hypothetical protein